MTREEAIKILKSGSTFAYDEKEAGDFCEAYDIAIKALEAQDVDAISRQAVLWMLTNLSYTQCKTQGEADVIDMAKTMVMTMPSAQPEIIRCKDCKWQKDQSGSTAWLPCRALVTPPDFYCGRAERRTDGVDC